MMTLFVDRLCGEPEDLLRTCVYAKPASLALIRSECNFSHFSSSWNKGQALAPCDLVYFNVNN